MGGSKSIGIKIIRKMILDDKLMSRYRLAREMGVSEETIKSWVDGKFFNEAVRLPKLIEVREKYMKMKAMGIYHGIHGAL